MQTNTISVESPELELETFRFPEGVKTVSHDGITTIADAAPMSIVNLVVYNFEFRENSNTPGRILEKSVVVNRPPNTGFFTCMPCFSGAFTTPDFRLLTERPLGQFFACIGLRGDNFVCRVRLTDSNADDPIFISVTGIIIFYS